jgi:hypothetical protein
MGMTPFNSVAGFSVGKGTANVILANGDVVTNNITVSNKANLSAISNVIITGGSAGQFIKTDGSGNLTFADVNTSGLANGNSNVQVYANGNVTVSVAGISNVLVVSNTGANVTGYFTASGNITGANANLGNTVTANYVAGTLTTNAQPNITSIGTLSSLTVTGNVAAGNVTGANVVSANYVAGTLTTNAQPNITSVGNLASLVVTSNVKVGNLTSNGNISTAVDLIAGNAVFIGNNAPAYELAFPNSVLLITANTGNYAQASLLNQNSNASADWVAYVDNGNADAGYADMGITGSAYNVPNYGLTKPGDGYFVVSGVPGFGGNLVIATAGTGTTNDIIFGTGYDTVNEVMRFSNSKQQFAIQPTTISTNNTTGALVVAGGAGIGGNLYAGGRINAANANLGNVVTANYFTGTLTTAAQPNITSVGTLTSLAVSGNANVGNIGATNANVTAITATGNVTASYFFGNGSQLSGIITSVSSMSNGTSNVNISTANGNVTTSVGGTANVLVVTSTGANITGNANVSGNVSASYFIGNGSSLTGIATTFNALTDANTANVTIDEIVYQGTTRLIVGHTGTTGYTFTQYTGLNPTIYTVSGTTLALDLTSAGHPLLIQYANGTNCDIGLTHVSTTGVLSVGSLAQAKTSGTLYWQIPIDLVGNFKYQCFNHVAMNGVFVLNDGNFSNGIASYSGNIGAGNVNVTGKVTAANVTANNNVSANVLHINTTGPQFGSATGEMAWNNTSKTYELQMNDGIQQSIGQEQFTVVQANTAISLGQVVAYAGVTAGRLLGDPANAQSAGFISSYVIGVAAQNIGVGNTGYVTTFGQLDNVNTNSFNVGDILYLDPAVPGGFTNVLPNAPNPKVQMAAVLTKALSTGSLQVKITGFPKLEQLRDVSTVAATNNQYLRYTTSGNYWVASNLAISNDTNPTLGANLNAANYSFANVNDISANTANFSGAVYSNAVISNASQLATKAYVDNASSAGIVVHPPVLVGTSTPLTTTYAQGGTTPTITTIATGNVLTTSTTHGLSVNDMIVFGSTTNGLTAGTPYFVYSTPAINQITLAASYNGIQITTLTNGTGLSITSRANSGVGATLTNAGTQAALVIGGVTMATTNRVLVFGQTNAFENGVYTVTNIGSPSTNWVLTRATDQNKYIPASTIGMSAGSYFYIQSGTRAGESDVLSTTGVIVIGTTNLTYSLFSASLQYTGVSPVTVVGQQISLANLTGTGDFVVLANSPTLNTPNIGAATGTSLNVSTGNINAGNLILTGLANVTGNITVGNLNAQSGNANVNVYLGNRVSVAGNVDGGNFNPGGNLVVTGNASAANISTGGTLNVTGNANVGNIGATAGVFTGNVTAGNANVTGQLISTVATGTAPFVVTSTTKVANLLVETANSTSYVNVAPVTSNISYPTFVYANIIGDYPLQSNTAFSANLANGAFISTTHVGNLVGTTANVTGQLISTIATGTAPLVVTSTTQVANLNVATAGSATSATNASALLQNTSTATTVYPTFTTSSANGNSSAVINTSISANLGNASITATTFVGALFGAATSAGTATSATTAGTVTTNAQPNITSVGTLSSLNVSGNANIGNIGTAQVLASANITAPQLISNIATGTAPFIVTSTTTVANLAAATATTAGTVTTAAQPNITSLGTLRNITLGSANSLTGGNLVSAAYLDGTLTTAAQPNITSVGTLSSLSVTGNANVGNLGTSQVLATANITAPQLISNIATGTAPFVVTSTTQVANLNVATAGTATTAGSATTAGTVTTNAQPNINSVGTLSSLNVSGNANVGNLGTAQVLATANITAPQLISNIATGTAPFVVTSNTLVTNLNADQLEGYNPVVANTASTIALRDANGNISANFFTGNGSQLTGIITSVSNVSNGTSNLNIATSGGNVTTSVGGVANVLVITTTGANIAGTLNTGTGNANVGNLGTAQVLASANITAPQLISNIATGTAPFIVTSTTQVANLSVATAGSATTAGSAATAGTVTTGAQPNITSVGSLSSLVVSGNANVGNLLTDNLKYANGVPYVIVSNAAGSNTQVQFNNANVFAGSANLTFDTTTNTLTTTTLLASNIGNATSVLRGDGGFISNITVSGGTSIVNGNSNVNIPVANGNITFSSAGNANVQVITGTGVNVSGTLNVTGITTLSAIGNVKITGGAANNVITTDGAGNLSFSAPIIPNYSVATVSANTTLSLGTYAYFAAGPITLTLPNPTGANTGRSFYIKNTNNQFVTLLPSINTINGYANMILRYLNSSLILVSDGTNWNIF